MKSPRILVVSATLAAGCLVVGESASLEPDAGPGSADADDGFDPTEFAAPSVARGTADPVPPPQLAPPVPPPATEWVFAEHAADLAGCDAVSDALAAKKCHLVSSTRKFQRQGLAICARILATDANVGVQCLTVAAEQAFEPRAATVCAEFKSAADAVRCLEAVAGRELAEADIERCSSPGKAKKTTRCLRNAPEYAFDRVALNAMAAKAAAQVKNRPAGSDDHQGLHAVIDSLRADVEAAAPHGGEHEEDRFLLNFAGGAIGHYKMLYCSAHEYVMVFGTPLATSGYSGKYRFEVNDWLISGEMQTHREGRLDTDDFAPGSWAQLFPGESKVYTTTDGTYMLEYARGPIASAYKFGVVTPTRSLSRNQSNRRAQIRTCAQGLAANERARRRMARREREQRKLLRREIAAQLDAVERGSIRG